MFIIREHSCSTLGLLWEMVKGGFYSITGVVGRVIEGDLCVLWAGRSRYCAERCGTAFRRYFSGISGKVVGFDLLCC